MPDLEKAIRVFEGSYKNSVLRHNGELVTVTDVLALLKEREPRVMTFEEALEAEYVYLDERPHSRLQCKCCILIKDEDGDIVPLNKGFWGSLKCDDYGIDWRCWTSRPDKATREAIPWE